MSAPDGIIAGPTVCPSCGGTAGECRRSGERLRCPACRAWTFAGHPPAGTPAERPGALRRALSSLLGRFRIVRRRAAPAAGRTIRDLPIDSIGMGGFVPRRTLDLDRQEMLDRSVALHGVLVPIVVRPWRGGFELVSGHRRILAARRAGMETVPAVVRELGARDAELFRYLENGSPDPPSPIEEAESIERMLLRDRGLSPEALASLLGEEAARLKDRLGLLRLPRILQEALAARLVDAPAARALSRLSSDEDILSWLERLSRMDAEIDAAIERAGGRAPAAEAPPSVAEETMAALDEVFDADRA